MVNSHTSFGKLKEVVVGVELDFTKRMSDLTFKLFYREAIGEAVYEIIGDEYHVNQELIKQRNVELDNLASLIESHGVTVHRPDRLNKITPFNTPTFKSEVSAASNVRDITLVYGDKLIETPTYVRNRYFENMALYNVYKNATEGKNWIKAPNGILTKDTIDMEKWYTKRDWDNVPDHFEMAIDGANFLRIGKDVIVNINSYNQWKGYEWIKSFYPNSNFHVIHVADNHIDGVIIALKPGVFLVNPIYPNIKDVMPDKFKNWTYLYPKDLTKQLDTTGMTDIDIQLASSRGMDVNVLSLDENKVVTNKLALGVNDILDKNGFDVITTTLDHGEIFAGGIHCSTLDLVREDECVSFL